MLFISIYLLILQSEINSEHTSRKITIMEKHQVKQMTALEKMLDDKKELSKCIREKGDIKKVLNERKIKLSTPL